MKKIVIITYAVLFYCWNVNSQENNKNFIENQDSISLEAESIVGVIDPDRSIILEPTGSLWTSGTGKIYYNGGKVGIGTSSPSHKLQVYSSGWKAKFSGPDGYIMIGPANSSWAHIYTDRPKFIFNKDIYSISGGFSAYSSANLYLKTNGTTRMTIKKSDGKVGIGYNNPKHTLHLYGTGEAGGGSKIAFGDNNTFEYANQYDGLNCLVGEYGTTDTDMLHLHGKKGIIITTGGYQFGVYEEAIRIDSKYAVGATTVRVNGTLIAKEMRCRTNVWSDYVFNNEYELKTLEEVEEFINKNNHLPDVPNESQVMEEGVNLGEMDAILLQKIEELTLYMIEQNQQIKSLQSELSKLKN